MRRSLAAILLLMALVLSACGRVNESGGELGSGAVSLPVQSAREPAAAGSFTGSGTMETQSTMSESRPLTEQEILLVYDRAAEAYGWFKQTTLPCSGSTETVDGVAYQRVNYPGIETLEGLTAYLRDLFSESVVEELLEEGGAVPIYRDLNGELYARSVDWEEEHTSGNETREVERVGDTAYEVNVSVEMLGEDLKTVTGVVCFSFPYALTDGRWVFTDFELLG